MAQVGNIVHHGGRRGNLLDRMIPMPEENPGARYILQGVRFQDGSLGPANASAEVIKRGLYALISVSPEPGQRAAPEMLIYDARRTVVASIARALRGEGTWTEVENAFNAPAHVKQNWGKDRRDNDYLKGLTVTNPAEEPSEVMLIAACNTLPGGALVEFFKARWHGSTSRGIVLAWKDAAMVVRAEEQGGQATPFLQASEGNRLTQWTFNGCAVREQRFWIVAEEDTAVAEDLADIEAAPEAPEAGKPVRRARQSTRRAKAEEDEAPKKGKARKTTKRSSRRGKDAADDE